MPGSRHKVVFRAVEVNPDNSVSGQMGSNVLRFGQPVDPIRRSSRGASGRTVFMTSVKYFQGASLSQGFL